MDSTRVCHVIAGVLATNLLWCRRICAVANLFQGPVDTMHKEACTMQIMQSPSMRPRMARCMGVRTCTCAMQAYEERTRAAAPKAIEFR